MLIDLPKPFKEIPNTPFPRAQYFDIEAGQLRSEIHKILADNEVYGYEIIEGIQVLKERDPLKHHRAIRHCNELWNEAQSVKVLADKQRWNKDLIPFNKG